VIFASVLIVLVCSERLALSQRDGGFSPRNPTLTGHLPPSRLENSEFPQPMPVLEDTMEFDEDGFAVLEEYRSLNIALRTDLPEEDAEALLSRLETLLTSLSSYWGQRPSGVFTCYVAQDVTRWPQSIIETMEMVGLSQMQVGAGYCSFIRVRRGPNFHSQAIIYAAANDAIVQHELVHAYCSHAFGHQGPLWYSEGMAEGGQYWGSGESGVQVDIRAIRYLRQSPDKAISEIIDLNEPGAWDDYKDRWSLCYFLDQHPSYSETFRELGRNMLMDRPVSFQRSFASDFDQITLEYGLFRQNIDQGYEVGLCTIDLTKHAYELSGDRMFDVEVAAKSGWQPVGLRVTPTQSVQYVAQGEWSLESDADPLNGEGDETGQGRLVGAILTDDFQMSDEISLGASGSFTPSAEGRLFVRCRDSWGSLADNEGELTTYWRLTPESAPVAQASLSGE